MYIVPFAPMSAEAHVISQSPGRTQILVTWKPAKKGVTPDWYDLDLFSNEVSQIQTVPGVSGTTTICCCMLCVHRMIVGEITAWKSARASEITKYLKGSSFEFFAFKLLCYYCAFI